MQFVYSNTTIHVSIPTKLELLVLLPNAIPRVECIINQTKLDNSSTTIVKQYGSEKIETTCRGQAIIERECELIVELKYNSHFYGMRVIRIRAIGRYSWHVIIYRLRILGYRGVHVAIIHNRGPIGLA